jgi:hypothetical protein
MGVLLLIVILYVVANSIGLTQRACSGPMSGFRRDKCRIATLLNSR